MRSITKTLGGGVAAGALAGSLFAVPAHANPAAANSSSARVDSAPVASVGDLAHRHREPRLASAWVAGWESTDPQQLARLFGADAVYTDHAVNKVSRGQAGVAQWQAGTHQLIPSVHATLVDAFRSGDRMLIQTIYAGQIVGAPHPFAVPMATVLHLRGDRIVTDDDYYNLSDLLAQSGLPPTWTPPQG